MVLLWKVWTPTPDQCLQDLAEHQRRKGRAGWSVLNKTSVDEHEAALPAFQNRRIYLSLCRAKGGCFLPRGTGKAIRQGGDDDCTRVEEAWNHRIVEHRHDFLAVAALPALLTNDVVAVELA